MNTNVVQLAVTTLAVAITYKLSYHSCQGKFNLTSTQVDRSSIIAFFSRQFDLLSRLLPKNY